MTPNHLGHDERLPLYQRLRDEIVAKIAVGEWLPGEAIPTEAELTRSYGVAVGTVRKAVDTLVSEGLLLRAQGRGTFVRRPNFDGSLFRFFRQVNASGESQVPQSLILTRTQEPPPAQVRQALNLAVGETTLCLERLRLIEGQPLLHEQIWLPAAKFGPLLAIDLSDFGTLLYPFYEEHCGMRVASARETLTVTSADEALAGVLQVAVDSPVVVVERVALGYDRQPLEYRLSRGAADTFRYQVEIS
ncbi:HTH-type transcriptional regulator FrlR [compost metagenome]|jgi:GntR family transcriptional regulator|uniref:GntR family transcriptional regulator n=1 Tax=Pseudomonas TaxID=286 RepID=UPI00048EC546|nr:MULTISPECIES: GntR family transcriptional regulator [Pseudomonas]MCW2271946.1 GntR family transcriptional regulator [Pseudomonas sp. JUb96]PRA63035.1 GntR family transcriptional regulator [Pseudomonas sp. MYb187]